jgi:hypothetical protein
MAMALTATRDSGNGLVDVLERILDKGLVLNADIAVSVAGVELLGIKIRAALASFETAARYGLEFPSGTSLSAPAWARMRSDTEPCPQCQKRLPLRALLFEGCPWCGWQSALSQHPLADGESSDPSAWRD